MLHPAVQFRRVRWQDKDLDAASSSYRAEMDTIEKEVGDVNRRLGNVYNAIENGDIDYVLLKPRLQELKKQHEKLLARKTELELLTSQRKIELADPKIVREYVADISRFLDSNELIESRVFIKSFIKDVTITGNEGRIRYALPLPPDNIAEEKVVLPIVQYSGPCFTQGRTFELAFSL